MTSINTSYTYLRHYLQSMNILEKTYLIHKRSAILPYIYSTILREPRTGISVHGFGVSSCSSYLARLKSISEAVERVSLLQQPRKKRFVIQKVSDGAIKTVPRNSIFYMSGSSRLPPNPGIGIAFGTGHEETLLRGAYELIEKDACLTTYLTESPLPHMHIQPILEKRPSLQNTVSHLETRGIAFIVLNATHDLGIPVYIALLIDTSGQGPALSIGSKAGFNAEENILNSIEEAIMIYITVKKLPHHSTPNLIRTPLERSMWWSSLKQLRHLSFWLGSSSGTAVPHTSRASDVRRELSHVVSLLQNQGHDLWYADISPSFIKDVSYRVYKVFLFGLQQYYYDETHRVISQNRLKAVSLFFNQKTKHRPTQTPHPFV